MDDENYNIDSIRNYAKQINDAHKQNIAPKSQPAIYVGLSTKQLTALLPLLNEFFHAKEDKYYRRRDPDMIEKAKNGLIAGKNLKIYVSSLIIKGLQ